MGTDVIPKGWTHLISESATSDLSDIRRACWLAMGPVVGTLLLIASACSSPIVPDDDPGLVGEIVRVGNGLWAGARDGPFQVHIKSPPDEECGIIFDIDSGTSISDSRNGRVQRAGVDVLVEGAQVAVWFGIVLDSCPAQSRALAIQRRR